MNNAHDQHDAHAATLSLILPAYNEAATLVQVVHECLGVLPTHFSDFELIIVDDGSSDETPRIAARLAAAYDPVVVLHQRTNRGIGAAIASGLGAARGGVVLIMAANRRYSIGDLARCMPYLDRYDLVAGYRMQQRTPVRRALAAGWQALLAALLFGLRLRDPHCAYLLARAQVLRDFALGEAGPLVWTEIAAKARRHAATCIEVGIHAYPAVGGPRRKPAGGTTLGMLRLWWRLTGYAPAGQAPAQGRAGWERKALLGGALAALFGGVWTAWRRR